ncbi:helix-turn-helix transcriptional regulator [Stutzerimonas kunmingensis]|uniref:helix-turn-helix transcriptional regulator n=1 Tax=Stutzerimonas kunmingensis TaxID=1211807 RepID=UPI0028AECF68|nr:AlpA family transcriptional regulator [Stutzerimonas kunmingensis]
MQANSKAQAPRLIRRPEVLERVGLSSSTLYEMTAAGEFPAPIPIGRQAVAWLDSEVDAWIKQRIELRDSRQRKRSAP